MDRRSVNWVGPAMGVAAAALVGAVMVLLVLFIDPLAAWVRVTPGRLAPSVVPGSATAFDLLRAVAALWAFFAVCLSLSGLPAWWGFVRVGRARLPYVVLIWLVGGFITAFLFETLWGLSGGPNLTASDSAGLTLQDGHITGHGWITALRRASLAGATGALMGLVFWIAAHGAPGRAD